MSSALDMSLDDLIKTNKKSTTTTTNTNTSSNPRFKGRFNGGSGPIRRSTNRPANRPNPYGAPAAKAPETAWKHDMYSDQVQGAAAAADGFGGGAGGRAAGAIETGTKLYISNLDYGVSNEDIKELFSEVGDLKRFSVHYDRSGRSKGTAEVVFSRRQDGIAAVKRYNNVQLDGKPMKIEIVGTNIPNPSAPPNPHAPPVPNWGSGNGGFEKSNGAPRSFPGRGGHNGLPRGGVGGGGSRGRGRGRGRGRAARPEPVSAADLDADLDKYHSDAMQI